MNVSTPKNLYSSNPSSASSASQIRASHLKPPQIETKGPSFLQQTRVSLYVPKHDSELPDYTNSPILLSDDQRSVRSIAQIFGLNTLDASGQSSLTKASGLIHKDTLNGHRSTPKPSISSSNQKSRGSNPETIDIFQEEKQLKQQRRHKKIEAFLNNKWVNLFMVLITIYSLFGQDFGTLVTSLESNEVVFDTLTITCCVSFFIELVLNFILRKEYRWSFFFWVDLISTGSLVIDLSFIPSQAIDLQANSTQIARAGRVSKIGARAGRVVTAFRLFKFGNMNKNQKETDGLLISKSNSHSVQSLTNLVDNIAKYKGQSTATPAPPALVRGRTSIEPQRRKSAMKSPELSKEMGDDEKAPLAGYQPRRLSKFAAVKEPLEMPRQSHTSPTRRKLDATKTFAASVSEVRKQNPQEEGGGGKSNLPEESRVGKILSQRTTSRVILIVLVLLILVPMMSSDVWSETKRSYTYDTYLIRNMFMNGSFTNDEISLLIWDIINRHVPTFTPIIRFNMSNPDIDYFVDPDYTTLRIVFVDIIDVEDILDMLVAVDLTEIAKITAATNIGRTFFICLVLALGSMLFSKDANKLVLRPLERMVEKVNRIAISPLSVKREALIDETVKKNEIAVLENAVTKIGTLLALGFGDAGAKIIAQNIAQAGDMNPMLSGEKVMAIFGFCDIRNFTDATEVLQEEVMVFVNSIADIVHDKVDKYGGSANKNIGDAFLLVWKFPDSETEDMDDEIQLKNTDLVRGLADLSLYSFLKIYAKINQSPVLKQYRSNAKLLERLPNYRVKMGFGLHVGWAIEGAIGSEFKIDASYLSPNVNIASRLEAATKQYGVPLLISNDLYVILSDEVQKFCKKIDVVTLKGSKVPMGLYTVDVDATNLRDKGPSKRQKKERITRHELKKQKLSEMICEGKLSTHLLFEKDKDLKIMMKSGMEVESRRIWEEGFEAYVDGDWRKARLMFDRCLVVKERDGPANTLLNYMRALDYKTPANWRGFRELTEK